MIFSKSQVIENKQVNIGSPRRRSCKKRGPQNEGISLWLAENKEDRKMTFHDFASIPKC
jgi:hypothetical protein